MRWTLSHCRQNHTVSRPTGAKCPRVEKSWGFLLRRSAHNPAKLLSGCALQPIWSDYVSVHRKIIRSRAVNPRTCSPFLHDVTKNTSGFMLIKPHKPAKLQGVCDGCDSRFSQVFYYVETWQTIDIVTCFSMM